MGGEKRSVAAIGWGRDRQLDRAVVAGLGGVVSEVMRTKRGGRDRSTLDTGPAIGRLTEEKSEGELGPETLQTRCRRRRRETTSLRIGRSRRERGERDLDHIAREAEERAGGGTIGLLEINGSKSTPLEGGLLPLNREQKRLLFFDHVSFKSIE